MRRVSAVGVGLFCLAFILPSGASAQARPGGNGPLPGDPGSAGPSASGGTPYGNSGYTPPPPDVSTSAALAYGRLDGDKGYHYWFKGNRTSEDAAQAAALSACRSGGGIDCRVVQVFSNGSVGIASSEDGGLYSIAQPGFYEAGEGALKVCRDAGKTGCITLMTHSSNRESFDYGAYWGDRRLGVTP